MQDDMLDVLHKLSYLEVHSNSITEHYYPCFTDEEIEAGMINLTEQCN